MNKEKERKIYVVGHKNPDTDSICSAIAYCCNVAMISGMSCFLRETTPGKKIE